VKWRVKKKKKTDLAPIKNVANRRKTKGDASLDAQTPKERQKKKKKKKKTKKFALVLYRPCDGRDAQEVYKKKLPSKITVGKEGDGRDGGARSSFFIKRLTIPALRKPRAPRP